MNFQFNPAQLSRVERNSLIEVLGVMESENDQEIEVRAIEFPLKFAVKLDDNVEMLLVWDAEKQCYAGITEPESLAKTVIEPEPDLDSKVKDLAERTYELMQIHLTFTPEQQLAFNKEYAKLWKERSE